MNAAYLPVHPHNLIVICYLLVFACPWLWLSAGTTVNSLSLMLFVLAEDKMCFPLWAWRQQDNCYHWAVEQEECLKWKTSSRQNYFSCFGISAHHWQLFIPAFVEMFWQHGFKWKVSTLRVIKTCVGKTEHSGRMDYETKNRPHSSYTGAKHPDWKWLGVWDCIVSLWHNSIGLCSHCVSLCCCVIHLHLLAVNLHDFAVVCFSLESHIVKRSRSAESINS